MYHWRSKWAPIFYASIKQFLIRDLLEIVYDWYHLQAAFINHQSYSSPIYVQCLLFLVIAIIFKNKNSKILAVHCYQSTSHDKWSTWLTSQKYQHIENVLGFQLWGNLLSIKAGLGLFTKNSRKYKLFWKKTLHI